ncbi:Rne/Rng family ribonuclease [Palleronia rufa]|uniref:Rne/Rng family ribonuclease n=1 Tax=Palleronia rufa TaxID=1530186 RepID=UPI000564C0B0|nr:ribonuclease E/G [Palleronia rufa]
MAKKMLIDATHAEETRVVVVDGHKVEEFDFESENKRQLAGNIYLAKVTRVEPSLQAAFVDYGGNRHGFLAFSEVHPDYYQIPVADRQALLDEEEAEAEAEAARNDPERRDGDKRGSSGRSRSRSRTRAARTETDEDAVATADLSGDDAAEAQAAAIAADAPGMNVVDVADDEGATAPGDDPRDPEKDDDEPRGYVAADDAAERDSSIESVADDDVTDEVRRPRKPRAKKYKIQEVIKVRQILLVQVVKEERGNKGAALTTYLSLPGRYCVLMPNTARGGGISRKITNAADRKKLKEIAGSIDVPKGAGLIIRTAGAKRTKTEIKRDYEYLQRMWEQIRELTLKSVAPAAIYEEGNLIKRSIRDLYNREIDEVWVEGEGGYRTAKDFMKMIMPSHAKNVKHYHDQLPLFARHQVETYLGAMYDPTVRLPSGGYIVIGVTEALVAIDVNSGKATKEGSIEETAYKTNMEAAEEVARQLRLRDLAGLIVIDFIDMEDRKHNANVEKHFKDKLKTDRARIQVGKISGFGLLEMSRQRLRPGMIEATTQPCKHCHGTGLLRSDDNVALAVLRQLEEEGTRKKSKEVCVTLPVAICNYLMNQKRDHVAMIESRFGLAVRLEADPALVSPDYRMEKLKHQTIRTVRQTAAITSSMAMMEEDENDIVEEQDELEVDEADAPAAAASEGGAEAPRDDTSEDKPKKKRRRRRRRKKTENGDGTTDEQEGNAAADRPREGDGDADVRPQPAEAAQDADSVTDGDATTQGDTGQDGDIAQDGDAPSKPRSRSRSRSRKKSPAADASVDAPVDAMAAAPASQAAVSEPVGEAEGGSDPAPARAAETAGAPETPPEPAFESPDMPPLETKSTRFGSPVPEEVSERVTEDAGVAPPVPDAPHAAANADEEPAEGDVAVTEDKPKKRGWWSLRK